MREGGVEYALRLAFAAPHLHTLVVSGPTGVGKSLCVRRFLSERGIPYRTIPVYVREDALRGDVDFEKTIATGRYQATEGLFDGRYRVFFVDDFHLAADEMRLCLLRNARERGVLLIATVNSSVGSLTTSEWESVDLHVAIENPDRERRIEILKLVSADRETGAVFMTETEVSSKGDRAVKRGNEASVVCDIDANGVASAEAPSVATVEISEAIVALSVSYVARAGCTGNAVEWILAEAARAAAALEGPAYVLPRHVETVSSYVLPHRMRSCDSGKGTHPSEEDNGSDDERNESSDSYDDAAPGAEDSETDERKKAPSEISEPKGSDSNPEKVPVDAEGVPTDGFPEGDEIESSDESSASGKDEVLPVEQRLQMIRADWKTVSDRLKRQGGGKRFATKTAETRGRYVRAVRSERASDDLALDATIRAAAPFQAVRKRNATTDLAVHIEPVDFRKKEREKKIGGYYLFIVDASGSMAARRRMEAVKGAITGLLRDAYVKRDKAALIVFRNDSAETVLPFTSGAESAERLMASLPTGGRTPLAKALEESCRLCGDLRRRQPAANITAVLVTDGRATFGETNDPVAEAERYADVFGQSGVRSVVIDTETGFLRLGIAKDIARRMRATYYPMDAIRADTVLEIVKGDTR